MIKRGELYYADLSPVIGSEQGGVRPVLIIQNDIGNRYSPTIIAAAVTSQLGKSNLPTHIRLDTTCGLPKDSVILTEQLRTRGGKLDSHTRKKGSCPRSVRHSPPLQGEGS